MNKLIFEGNEYELKEINNDRFLIHSEEPMQNMGGIPYCKECGNKSWAYKSLQINGKFYLYKPIEKE